MTYAYPGHELDLFRHATNWKRYCARQLQPYLAGDVLEVGAGIGATARALCDARARSWTCLEPDAGLAARLTTALEDEPLMVPSRVVGGTVRDLQADARFDTILYVDVLEHIEDDRAELERSAAHLRPDGRIVVLAPAHNWLFSPFDRAIGHHRRYSVSMLARITPSTLRLASAFYMDSAGMTASLANRLLFRAQYPSVAQIRLWDSIFVRVSRALDPLTWHRIGKTVVGIWTQASSDASRRA